MRVQRGAGRPLRFLVLALGGWTAARVVLLWPAAMPIATAAGSPRIVLADAVPSIRSASPASPPAIAAPARLGQAAAAAAGRAPRAYRAQPFARPATSIALALSATDPIGDPASTTAHRPPAAVIPPPLRPTPLAVGRSRLAGSAWLIARGGSSAVPRGALTGGQLGASQAGARLTYALGPATDGVRRIALSARVASPLRGRGAEAAVGLDWQPTHLPLHLLAEQRVPLDGGRGGPALLLIGGIDPTPVGGGFRLEGYAQAGAIARARDAGGVEAFGDGAARLTRSLTTGPVRLDLGAGAWAAAQRTARGLDLGATAGALVPVATRQLRVTLDWRQRIAGNAQPGSGPALSIGTDF